MPKFLEENGGLIVAIRPKKLPSWGEILASNAFPVWPTAPRPKPLGRHPLRGTPPESVGFRKRLDRPRPDHQVMAFACHCDPCHLRY